MTNISIAIPNDLSDFLSQIIKNGQVSGPSELITLALYAFRDQMELERIKGVRLKNEIQVGLDQIKRREYAEYNLEEFLASMHAERSQNAG